MPLLISWSLARPSLSVSPPTPAKAAESAAIEVVVAAIRIEVVVVATVEIVVEVVGSVENGLNVVVVVLEVNPEELELDELPDDDPLDDEDDPEDEDDEPLDDEDEDEEVRALGSRMMSSLHPLTLPKTETSRLKLATYATCPSSTDPRIIPHRPHKHGVN